MRTTTRLGVGLVAAVLSLSACTVPDAPTSPSATATPSASTAPSTPATAAPPPAPTSAPVVTPAPAAPVADYDFTRLFSMHAGDKFSDFAGRSDVTVTPYPDCPWLANVTVSGVDPAVGFSWDSEGVDPTGPAQVFQILSDPAVVPASPPVNAEGIGIGSSMSDVLATYPGAMIHTETESSAGTTVTQVRVDDPASDGRYYFWAYSPTDRVFRIDLGSFPTDGYWPLGWDCVD